MTNEMERVQGLPTPGQLLMQSWDICKERPLQAFGFTLAITGTMLLGNLALTAINQGLSAHLFGPSVTAGSLGVAFAFWLVKTLVGSIGTGVLVAVWLRIVRRQELDGSLFMAVATSSLSLGAMSLITSAVTTIGFIMLIVPGVVLSFGWLLAPYFVLDKKAGPIEALRLSWRATMGAKLELFAVYMMVLVVSVIAAIPLGLGLPVVIPVAAGVMTLCYQHLAPGAEQVSEAHYVAPVVSNPVVPPPMMTPAAAPSFAPPSAPPMGPPGPPPTH